MTNKSIVKLDSDYLAENNVSQLNGFVKSANIKKEQLNRKAIFTMLQDGDTYAFTLLTICLICYPNEVFKVDPLVLFQYLKEDFGAELSDDNQNKLNAILIAITSNYFFTDLQIFKSICQTLTEGDPGLFDPGFEDPTLPEIIWGMYEVNLAYGEDDKEAYSPEIETFVDLTMSKDSYDAENQDLTDEETYQEFLYSNVADLKQQLLDIGLKDLPKFPKFDF